MKNVLSKQNLWNSTQIAADVYIKKYQIKKSYSEEESVAFTFPYQTNRNHVMDVSVVGHVISEQHWKST